MPVPGGSAAGSVHTGAGHTPDAPPSPHVARGWGAGKGTARSPSAGLSAEREESGQDQSGG